MHSLAVFRPISQQLFFTLRASCLVCHLARTRTPADGPKPPGMDEKSKKKLGGSKFGPHGRLPGSLSRREGLAPRPDPLGSCGWSPRSSCCCARRAASRSARWSSSGTPATDFPRECVRCGGTKSISHHLGNPRMVSHGVLGEDSGHPQYHRRGQDFVESGCISVPWKKKDKKKGMIRTDCKRLPIAACSICHSPVCAFTILLQWHKVACLHLQATTLISFGREKGDIESNLLPKAHSLAEVQYVLSTVWTSSKRSGNLSPPIARQSISSKEANRCRLKKGRARVALEALIKPSKMHGQAFVRTTHVRTRCLLSVCSQCSLQVQLSRYSACGLRKRQISTLPNTHQKNAR